MVSLKEKSLVPVASCLQLASSSPFPHTRMEEAFFLSLKRFFFQVGNPRTRRKGREKQGLDRAESHGEKHYAVLPPSEKKWKVEA